jgi:AraC-like DNA-binding protein
MTVVLDATLLPERDRAEAVVAAMRQAGVPAHVTHEDPDDVYARIEVFDLGGGTTIMHRQGTGVGLRRTAAQVRVAAPERIALTVVGPGRFVYVQADHYRATASRQPQMMLTDHSATYQFDRIGGGETFSLSFDHTTLALPVDVIRAAVGRLEASPLFDVVRAHLLRVGRELQAVPPGPARAMLGNSMAELVRALITTTAQDTPAGRAALAETLRRRIADHLERHFADPDLTPAAIARAHNISLRQLYRVWTAEELSLSEWIVARRLEEARRALAAPAAGATTIGAVARRCGFADAAHFSRRFRSAYGLSPRQWQALHRP